MTNRILFILPSLPWPLISGGHQALFNGIKAFENIADIYIFYPVIPRFEKKIYHEELMSKIDNIKGIFPYVEKKRKWTKRKIAARICAKVINSLFRATPFEKFEIEAKGTGLSGHSDEYYTLIRDIISKYNINIVQVEMLANIDAIIAIPNNVKKVFVHHELGFVRNQLLLKQLLGSDYSGQLVYELEKTKEIGLLNRYDAVVSLSPIDRDKLIDAGVNTPIFPSFAVVNTSTNKSPFYIRTGKILSFVGPEYHTPNKLGMEWFLKNVWLELKKASPEYELNIVGVWTKETISHWTSEYPDIHFLGFVDNLTESLSNSVMIVPILVGSGIRMKILEAMSIGIPFVTTKVGAEGIPVTDGKECFIASTRDEFVNGIHKLENVDIRKMMVENGRKLLQSSYSFEKFKIDRENIINSII
jgi:glycosyltransferase involved in cell wall biosynthesis